jgi:hypothetical protein
MVKGGKVVLTTSLGVAADVVRTTNTWPIRRRTEYLAGNDVTIRSREWQGPHNGCETAPECGEDGRISRASSGLAGAENKFRPSPRLRT